jgi:Rrf2 family protein
MSKIVSISEAASIALHAMILIARSKGNSVNVDHIAEITQSSRHHVAKVLQRLSKDGFVGSFRGPSGGFYLTKDSANITLLEIYESIEGKVTTSSCPVDRQICSFEKCFMNNVTNQLTLQFKDYMNSQKLSEYL